MSRNKNVILEKIRVENYAAEGKSVAKVNGKVVFIENTVPGDVVDVRLFKNKKDWAEGYPLMFHEYSGLRTEAFCSHFGVCGGCQWQMLAYERQLEYKQKQVEENLKRIGKVQLPELRPILAAKETRFYRNKLEYTFSNNEFLPEEEFKKLPAGKLVEAAVAGFHAKGVFDKVIDIKNCYLQPEPTNAIRMAVKEFAKARGYSFYDIRHHRGLMRTMQLRICSTGEIMVNIVFGEDPGEEKIAELLDFVLKKFPQITSLLYTINTKKNDSLYGLEPVIYSGPGYVVEKLSAVSGEVLQFKIGPKSFFQTNTRQAEALYRVVAEFADLHGNENVYDLYCGTGSIGIFLGRNAKKIIGVEISEDAVNDARENAELNHVSGLARFFTGDVVHLCNEEFFDQHGHPDVIVTDPPRAGMHSKLLAKILAISAPTVIYVSCNPATQARDLSVLDEKYTVANVQPVDMFPHTHHIENIVQLKLR